MGKFKLSFGNVICVCSQKKPSFINDLNDGTHPSGLSRYNVVSNCRAGCYTPLGVNLSMSPLDNVETGFQQTTDRHSFEN